MAVGFVIGIRSWRKQRNQLLRMRHSRKIAQHDAIHLADRACRDANAESQRNQRYCCEARRFGEGAQAEAKVLANLCSVLSWNTMSDIPQQANDSNYAVFLRGKCACIIAGLQQFFAV